MPRAHVNAVLNFEFLLHALAEQHRIVSVLDQANVACALPTLHRGRGRQRQSGDQYSLQRQTTGVPRLCAVQYVKVGVEELDQDKLPPLLKLKYNNAIADAVADPDRPEQIGHRLAFSAHSTPLF